MTAVQAVALFLAAVLGGALNSVAGGGSLVTFPALLLAGVPAIPANATSAVALWPGSMSGAWAYRDEVRRAPHMRLLAALGLVGGVIGALVLLHTPSKTFSAMVPYLLLGATAAFAVGPIVRRRLRPADGGAPGSARQGIVGLAVTQFLISVYGGFFGGGFGILVLAGLGLAGLDDIHVMNAMKTVLQAMNKGAAVVAFALAGTVMWSQAVVMVAGAILGGYVGATVAKRLSPVLVRWIVIVVGAGLGVYFLVT